MPHRLAGRRGDGESGLLRHEASDDFGDGMDLARQVELVALTESEGQVSEDASATSTLTLTATEAVQGESTSLCSLRLCGRLPVSL